MPRSLTSEAIVLSRKNYGEADRILTLFTKDYGKITAIARGVRKPKSKKRSSIEVFSKFKFSGSKFGDFYLVTETDILDSFSSIRRDLKKVTVAYFFLEAINKLTQPEEENKALYNLLVSALEKLSSSSKLKTIRERFVEEILILLGFWQEGKKIGDIDTALESVVERQMNTKRVGKMLQ